jgi:hypothetical protein
MLKLVVSCVFIALVTAFAPRVNQAPITINTDYGNTAHSRSSRYVYAPFKTALAMAQARAPFKRPRRQNAPGNIYVDER